MILFPGIEDKTILTIGDCMLDTYWHSSVERISPEGPVPVAKLERVEQRLGGAGNVCANVAALGARSRLIGCLGNDPIKPIFLELLSATGVDGLLAESQGTINKVRIMARGQMVYRMDLDIQQPAITPETEGVTGEIDRSDLIILSDYGKGTLDRANLLIDYAREKGKLVLVDPTGRDRWNMYRGATLIKPNSKEFAAVTRGWKTEDEFLTAAHQLRDELNLTWLLVTRGSLGMSLVGQTDIKNVPADFFKHAHTHEVYDVTGAGDVVMAAMACGLLVHPSHPDKCVDIANVAASMAVQQPGAAVITRQELAVATGMEIPPQIHEGKMG
jgi:D-beta-D-heptose 7-phosphate kinase/D-beta-D-heptose 1-phosphate adenosyltransferase